MKHHQDIKFTTSQSVSQLNAGKVCYQGQIVHNQTLTPDETRKDFAEYMRQPLPMANLAIDSIAAFIAEQIAAGNRVNFGPFSAGIKMRGGLPAANAPFDPSANELTVELTPGKELRQAVEGLRPVNATPIDETRLNTSAQLEPYEMQDAFSASGIRTIEVTGRNILVHPGATGEGVWIENDAGVKLLQGEYLEGNYAYLRFRLTGDIDPGLYWIAVCSRCEGESYLRRVQRRITAV